MNAGKKGKLGDRSRKSREELNEIEKGR